MKTTAPFVGGLAFLMAVSMAAAQQGGQPPGSQVSPSQVRVIESASAEPESAEPESAELENAERARRIQARPAEPVDGVQQDLQRIVVLCATEPSSEEFEQAWTAYVAEHDVAAEHLDELIADVLRRAAAYRERRAGERRAGRSRVTSVAIDVEVTGKAMHEIAMGVIRNIGN